MDLYEIHWLHEHTTRVADFDTIEKAFSVAKTVKKAQNQALSR